QRVLAEGNRHVYRCTSRLLRVVQLQAPQVQFSFLLAVFERKLKRGILQSTNDCAFLTIEKGRNLFSRCVQSAKLFKLKLVNLNFGAAWPSRRFTSRHSRTVLVSNSPKKAVEIATMDEDVVAAVIRSDETVSLFI